MRYLLISKLISILMIAAAPTASAGDNQAQPDEVTAKVRKAAAFLSEQGAAGLDVLRDKNSEFMWKDTYVFVVNCDADEVLANPAFPERQGGDIKQHADYNGKPYGRELCRTANEPSGGWVEYVWLKPGGDVPLRKISYVMSVHGMPYQVGAGIYHPTIKLEDLAAAVEMSE